MENRSGTLEPKWCDIPHLFSNIFLSLIPNKARIFPIFREKANFWGFICLEIDLNRFAFKSILRIDKSICKGKISRVDHALYFTL